jgi:hypothetical protein
VRPRPVAESARDDDIVPMMIAIMIVVEWFEFEDGRGKKCLSQKTRICHY